MALEFQNLYFDVTLDPTFTRTLQRSELARVGENETDLFTYGYAEYWRDRPARPGEFYELQIGARTLVGERVEQVDTWVEWAAADKRQALLGSIDEQVPVFSATQTLRDPGKDLDVTRFASAATDKTLELEETADADLDTFDPTLDVVDPQDGVGYSRLTTGIIYLTPWAGAPDNDIGFEALLEIETAYEDEGAEARILVVEGADQGAVLPLTQDATDPQKWRVESRDGHKWSDPNQGTALQLLWGAGSLPVSPTIRLEKLHDRKADFVRYAVAASSRGRRRP